MGQISAPVSAKFSTVRVCDNPVFVIGAPRSGTTVLASALGEHSGLWSSAESFFLHTFFAHKRAEAAFVPEMNGQPQWLGVNQVSFDEFLAFVGLGFNALFTSRSDGKRWVEKTPVDTLITSTLAGLFPGAQFVHILRDARTTIRSMLGHRIATRNPMVAPREEVPPGVVASEVVPAWTESFPDACRTWVRHVRVALQFEAENPERCLTVRHERLVADPAAAFAEICAFLEIPEEEAPVQYCLSETPNSSFQGSRRNLADRSGAAKDWTVEEKRVFVEVAGRLQYDLGFMSAVELADMEDDVRAVDTGWPARWAALAERPKAIARLRDVVDAVIPPGASVLVVSKGDEELVALPGRIGAHFPQDRAGAYAGHYPGSDAEAIEHLEGLRRQGAEYLVFPQTAFWWLDHYPEFRHHLDGSYRRITDDGKHIIFQLTPSD